MINDFRVEEAQTKRILLSILAIGVLLLSACGAPSGTLKIAVFNNCKTDIIDTQILINNEVVKHIPIYNGYWADFGSYEVTNDYNVTIKVIRYHASGEKGTEMEKTVAASGSSNMGFWVNEKAISIKGYPEVVLKPVPAKIPEGVTVTPGRRPEDVIPVSVLGFKFIEKSEHVKSVFEGEEYSAYSFFQPVPGSKFQDKVDSLEVCVYKFKDEASAIETFSMFAEVGAEVGTAEQIQVNNVEAMLTYREDYGEASVFWQHGKVVILSNAIPPFEVTTFDKQVLKDAALEGARATAQKL